MMSSSIDELKLKIGIGALVLLGILGPSLGIAACCKNYAEFAADCRARGGDPYPNPARCESRGGAGPTSAPPPSYPNVERRADGMYYAAEGYRWVIRPPIPGDMRVELVPEGSPHERFPNVVWTGNGKLRPQGGYHWVNRDNPKEAGYAVERVDAGTRHERYPNVVWTEDGKFRPKEGYTWENRDNPSEAGYAVVRVSAGTRHERYPNVVWTTDGELLPKEGYRWANRDNPSEAGYAVERLSAVEAARVVDREIKEAISRGETTSFSDASDSYQRTRTVAHGLAPDESRCALVLSMTFGLTPRVGEKTLKDLGVIPNIREAQLASRYYVNAKELANRFKEVWGQPHEIVGEDAAVRLLRGRKGVIYIEGGFGFTVGLTSGFPWLLRRGNHIDLWDGTKMSWAAATPGRTSINGEESFATGTTTQQALSRASKIWFWEWSRS